MIFLKCKIRFIYVGFNCKRKKSGVKKCLEILPLRGGGEPLMANAILNFHFDFLNPSLRSILFPRQWSIQTLVGLLALPRPLSTSPLGARTTWACSPAPLIHKPAPPLLWDLQLLRPQQSPPSSSFTPPPPSQFFFGFILLPPPQTRTSLIPIIAA